MSGGYGRQDGLVAGAAEIVWTADDDATLRSVSGNVDQLGRAEDELLGRCVFELLHPADRPALRSAWEQALRSPGQAQEAECRTAGSAGDWRWLRLTVVDLRQDPQVGAVVGHALDVTAARADREYRLRHQGQLRGRFEGSSIPQATIDADGNFVAVNPAMAALLGAEPAWLVSRPVSSLNHPSDPGDADRSLAAVLSGEVASTRTERVVAAADGSPLPVLADLNVLLDEHGTAVGAALFWQDLSRLRDAELARERQELLYATLMRRASDLALVADADGRILYVSAAAWHMLGYEPADVMTLNGWDFVHRDDLEQAQWAFAQVVAEGGTGTFTVRVRNARGEWRWVEATAANLIGAPVDGVVCNLRDVTERVQAESALRASEARYRAIVETGSEGVWVSTQEGRTLYVNPRMAQILGRSEQSLYQLSAPDLLDETQAQALRVRLAGRAQIGDERYELRYVHPDGGERILSVGATPLEAPDGSTEGSLVMVSDVTQARRSEEQLRHAALHDALTGLPNRALMRDRLEHALQRQTLGTAVLLVDLDQFKVVNDSRGHGVGDDLLQAVAQRLQMAARPGDTVARFGGDEFVLVFEEVSPALAGELSDQILTTFGAPFDVEDGQVSIGASAGLAVSPPANATDLLRYADIALYHAKATGRGRVQLFDATLARDAEHRHTLAADLRQALTHGDDGLTLHYQPVVELDTGRVLGLEALCRWTHPVHGAVPPAEFIPAAEQAGLAALVDTWAVHRAVSDLAGLRAQAAVPADAYVAVNLSARNLTDPGLEALVVDATAAAGLQPSAVVLEITEGAIMDDAQVAVQRLQRLRDRGFGIAIDDFGTGYSSLAYLRDLPVTTLKIDRSFVAHITEDRDALAIVASIVDLARAVGVRVTAEGVETPQQAGLLQSLGCRAGQGWTWSPAVPPDQIAAARWTQPFAVPEPGSVTAPRPRRARPQVAQKHGLERLIQLHEQGASLATIAAALNSEGFRTPEGRRWHSSSVASAITEIAYPSLREN